MLDFVRLDSIFNQWQFNLFPFETVYLCMKIYRNWFKIRILP